MAWVSGRLGRADGVVYAAQCLASDESCCTTGTAFVVDGGITVNYFGGRSCAERQLTPLRQGRKIQR